MAECGISNIASCLPEQIFSYFAGLMNQSLDPMAGWIKGLLSHPIDITIYSGIWAIIVYALSLFYGLLIIYVGFNLMLSGYDAAKRESAKGWLRNILIMILLVQASYFIYGLIIDISSLLSSAVLGLVDERFFLLAPDNIANFGLEMLLLIPYTIILLSTALMLLVRYFIVALGVVLFPIGIFLYFIPVTENYGRFMLKFVCVNIFATFFYGIIILVCSKLLGVGFFDNMKMLVTMCAFLLIHIFTFLLNLVMFVKVGDKAGKYAKYLV
ncbi:MAG: hypothetical protein V1906_00045 [Candidatus Woesearchaeota archaeon]